MQQIPLSKWWTIPRHCVWDHVERRTRQECWCVFCLYDGDGNLQLTAPCGSPPRPGYLTCTRHKRCEYEARRIYTGREESAPPEQHRLDLTVQARRKAKASAAAAIRKAFKPVVRRRVLRVEPNPNPKKCWCVLEVSTLDDDGNVASVITRHCNMPVGTGWRTCSYHKQHRQFADDYGLPNTHTLQATG